MKHRHIDLGGIGFSLIECDNLIREWDDCISERQKTYVCFCEAHLWTRAVRETDVAAALNQADYVLPDGVGITLGARMCGFRFHERMPGPVIMLRYCAHGVDKGYKHFFYGGGDGVAETLKCRFEEKFPGIKIVGTHCPPFRPLADVEKKQVADMINASGADVVWVGLGAPKQEKWMEEFAPLLDAPLLMGVGAAFDFHTANRRWAPAWIRRIGMEWLFRALTGGPKMFMRYAKTIPVYCFLMGKCALRRRLGKK